MDSSFTAKPQPRVAVSSLAKTRNLVAMFSLIILVLITITVQAHAQDQAKTQSRHSSKAIRKFGVIAIAYKDLIKVIENEAENDVWNSNHTKQNREDVEPFIYNFDAEVSYGDLTGDGEEEAAVVVGYHMGVGSNVGNDLFLYALRHGKPQLIAKLGIGSLALGGICHGWIYCPDCDILESSKRQLVVTRYRPDKMHDCHSCYGFLETTTYELRGDKLVAVDVKTQPLSELDPEDLCYRKPYTPD